MFRRFRFINIGWVALWLPLLAAIAKAAPAVEPVTVTVIHTNDLHSHFRAEKTPLGLGGIARIKSAVRQIRQQNPNSFLVDGGDWSEGNIYYTEGFGAETLRMMEHVGYDVAVVGNHDWLNGADTLIGAIHESNTKMSVIAANLELDSYSRREELRRLIPPYVIRETGGVKIAFIGLVTYEFIYDRFFDPVGITEPFTLTRELAARLKKQVDAVVVISHNGLTVNKAILHAAPDVDLIVGAHDHKKLTRPEVVQRSGRNPAWIVEAGSWGRYVGRVDIKVFPRVGTANSAKIELSNYKLLQMDSRIPEDPETLDRIDRLDRAIEARMGPMFHDHVGRVETALHRNGFESPIGNFTTDAYYRATAADIAVDHVNLIYGELHAGDIRAVDVFNANPGVFSPTTNKSWTLHTLEMKGFTLSWLLKLIYSNKMLAKFASISFSGMQLVLNSKINQPQITPEPAFGVSNLFTDPQEDINSLLHAVLIGDKPLDVRSTYRLALSEGTVEALRLLNSFGPNVIPLASLRDTGVEDWRIMADYLRAISPVTPDKVQIGNRLVTLQPDLGIIDYDVKWEKQLHTAVGIRGRIVATVRNYGLSPSPDGARVRLLINANGSDYTVDPDYRDAGFAMNLPMLAPGASRTLTWDDVLIPEHLGVHTVTVRIEENHGEFNNTNDEVTRVFPATRQ